MPTKTPDATIVPGRQAREHLRTVTRDLRCQLTDAEIRERGEQLARMRRDYDVMLDKHKAEKTAMRTAEKDLDGRIGEKAYDVRTHTEERAIECHWQADYVRDKAVLVRSDTGEEIDHRPLTDDERQRKLL